MSRAQILSLQACVALTAIAGALFAWMRYGMQSDDPFAIANHPLQPAMLTIHVVVAPLLIFVFGWIFNEHVLTKFRNRAPNRLTGVWSAVLFAVMAMSGYLLQVSTHEALQRAMRVTHWVTSGLFVIAYAVHVMRGKAIARASGRAG